MKTERKFALIAGITLIFMAVAAIFTYGYIHNTLVVSGNPGITVANLKANGGLFQTEILGWHAILLCDVIVAWALFHFFKNENRKLSAITAGLRFVYTAILGVSIMNFIYILKIVNGNITITSESANQQIMAHFESFETLWSFGLIIFGFHLLLLGVLALQSERIQNFWGIVLVFAAVSYMVIHTSKLLLPEFESQVKTVETMLSLPMAFGEVGFAFWLIIRGGKPRTVFRRDESELKVLNQELIK